jgi:hypothetical protein
MHCTGDCKAPLAALPPGALQVGAVAAATVYQTYGYGSGAGYRTTGAYAGIQR